MLGTAGCLLFTDPINEAPVVTVKPLSETVYRGRPARFSVQVGDDRDDPSTIRVRWYTRFGLADEGCNWITTASWAGVSLEQSPLQSSDAPYEIRPTTPDAICVCVLATDRDGASANSCKRVEVENPDPIAEITYGSGLLTSAPFPPCSQVHVTARTSTYPSDPSTDQIRFNWSGVDPAGKPLALEACEDSSASLPELDRCFSAPASGNYTVTLTIDDKVLVGKTNVTTRSTPASLVVSVANDTPPCLKRTDPPIDARVALLPVCHPGVPCESRTFKALLVADDCEPYPVPSGSGKSPTEFIWWVYDSTKSDPAWVRQVNSSESYILSQIQFGNARPGDTIKLRLEVRDSNYRPSSSTCSLNKDVCYEADAGAGTGDCVRWTTWTVQFQP